MFVLVCVGAPQSPLISVEKRLPHKMTRIFWPLDRSAVKVFGSVDELKDKVFAQSQGDSRSKEEKIAPTFSAIFGGHFCYKTV